MTATKQRYQDLLTQISRTILPTDTTAVYWINKCPKKELLQLGAELNIVCDDSINIGVSLCVNDKYNNVLNQSIEITLWEK